MRRFWFWIRNLPAFGRTVATVAAASVACFFGGVCFIGALRVRHFIAAEQRWIDYGLVSARVITDAGVAFLVDDWDTGATDIGNMNFHASGTGALAENVTDTALGAEVAARVAGTKSQPAANQLQTVGTINYAAAFAITEHGIFSQLALGGTLWDRSVFAAINVGNGDAIEFTYTCTVNAGG